MTNRNFYDPASVQEMLGRIARITPQHQAKWGAMNVGQMLAHAANTMDMGMGKINPPRPLIGRLIGGFFRSQYTSEKPFSKGSPTSDELRITTPRNFDEEKARLIASLKQFADAGEAGCTKHPHPFFGELTPAEWARGLYKHLDHHLQQFGA